MEKDLENKKYQYIVDFEKLFFGMFVHFGIYSLTKKGEWCKKMYNISEKEYQKYFDNFKVHKSWAKEIVKTAKNAGMKYITIVARHHDGFSLYDTCGLNDYDSLHTPTKLDLIKEFVDECHKQDIVPMFYHTLLDWRCEDYENNFDKYIDYLVKSVEILCKNYGKIGGFWFDGYWDKPHANWQFDRLYQTIRKYQPDAMIINNTGLSALGEVTHYEIDAVTFERGKPAKLHNGDGKYRAGEVCDSLTDHWGYAENDVCIKSIPSLISEIIDCKGCRCNFLLNVAPLPNGMLRPIEKYTLLELGKWMKKCRSFIYNSCPADIEADNAVIVKDEKYYYAFIKNVPMVANENVSRQQQGLLVSIHSDKKIYDACYLDDKKQKVDIDHKSNSIKISSFSYGTSFFARVIRFKLK